MAKNRNAVTCNGRASFYACMWEDIRNCAMDNGWAVAIHGSLNSDMDIMAMPWVEEAVSFEELIDKISKLFSGNAMSEQYVLTYDEKTHNRVVATIPIWADFYLDISTILTTNAEVERLEYILLGVMHSVDKWLEGDELEQDEVNRAATMREKTLQIIERLGTSVARGIFAEIDSACIDVFGNFNERKYVELKKQYGGANNESNTD